MLFIVTYLPRILISIINLTRPYALDFVIGDPPPALRGSRDQYLVTSPRPKNTLLVLVVML